ncbi:BTAD domain-containing putative transcriptional regulator [Amycolatopsis sp. NPDC088138]|uniref:AfsR/SARP family transcriptional regulator n=1 Tax=Amycolatopsis sp. NPDC088138 TaxID=3363938 RepID=UPI003828BC33
MRAAARWCDDGPDGPDREEETVLFQVLGPVTARGRDGAALELGPGKPVTVLATLLRHAGAWVSVDELVDATWADRRPPASAEANLKTYIWRLRRVLPSPADGGRIEHRPGAYRIRVEPGELDADLAADLAARAGAALAEGAHETAAALAGRGLALWRGRPFEGVAGKTPVAAAVRLGELRWELRELLARARQAAGRAGEAVVLLRELVTEDPLREGAWTLLVDALTAAGRRGEALSAYCDARRVLAAELGVEPGAGLAAAYRRALSGPAPARRELPRDVPGFTGRDTELALLRDAPEPIVLLEGMPGAGKSALAVRLAHELADRFPDGQFHVELGADGDPGAVLARLLRAIGVDALPADLGERAALWRSEIAGRRILLVLDDAVSARQVAPLLPGAGPARTLITTRDGGWHVPGARRVTLEPLDDKTAAALVHACTGDTRPLGELLAFCGGLPDLLRAAGDRLAARPHWRIADVVAWLAAEVSPARLDASVQRLAPAERTAFRAFAARPGEVGVPLVARRLRVSQAEARRLLERLVDVHLLAAPGPGRYRALVTALGDQGVHVA